eukprot:COSAG06_NODE_6096_length_3113_cov_2.928003_5_plen_179_part_00
MQFAVYHAMALGRKRKNDRFFPFAPFSFWHSNTRIVCPPKKQAWDRHDTDVALTKPIGAFVCFVLLSQGLLSDAHLFLLEDMVADLIALRSSSSASAPGGGNGAGAAAHEMHVAAEQMSQLLGYVRTHIYYAMRYALCAAVHCRDKQSERERAPSGCCCIASYHATKKRTQADRQTDR